MFDRSTLIRISKIDSSRLIPVVNKVGFFNNHAQRFSSISSTKYQFINQAGSNLHLPQAKSKNIVYLGLGSNLGNRLKNLSDAINSLSNSTHRNETNIIQLLDSSFVYQSEPMYLTNQPEFLNAVCKISTTLSPDELLKVVKKIEVDQGRIIQNVPRNSPRPIDIDILMFNSDVVNESNLSIPHIGMLERRFVLEPLSDVAKQVIHPIKNLSISSLLANLKNSSESAVRRTQLITAKGCPTLDLTTRTHLMSIVNCTPDSFSDGGRSYLLEDAISTCLEHVSAGADILDIGGMSTRPGAQDVSIEEEINRTVPVIRALREQHRLNCHISIDTFRADTAKAAVEAGATLVNDVSGGQADKDMYQTVAKLDVPYVMMHMRGNSHTMNELVSYIDSDVLRGVQRELAHNVKSALRSGIKRWKIIIDPGFGFAKNFEGNCQLLNCLDQLQQAPMQQQQKQKQQLLSSSLKENNNDPQESDENFLYGFPLLVGLSRKRFLGELLIRNHNDDNPRIGIPSPDQRLTPTIVASTLAISKGAQVIRAHDTKAIKQVIETIDGIRLFGRRGSLLS